MIIFERMKFKNILSYGNTYTDYSFTDAKSTIIQGKNGTGKSGGIIDSITFALYGKPFRKVSIPQLINSINGKELEVQIEFRIGDNKYKVVRGRKPNIFEIWMNDSMIPQSAALKDYQRILTDQILCMNYDTFTQIVILGSSSFTPFMELTPPTRKSIIENLLDISVFSTMNQIVREKLNKYKEDLQDLTHKLELKETTYNIMKKHNKETLASAEDQILELNFKIQAYTALIEADKSSIASLDIDINRSTEINIAEINSKRSQLNEWRIRISGNINNLQKKMEFLKNNSQCSQCSQPISEDFVQAQTDSIVPQIEEMNVGISKLERKLSLIDEDISKANEEKSQLRSLKQKKDALVVKIQSNTVFIYSLNADIQKLNDNKENTVSDASLLEDKNIINEMKKDLRVAMAKGHVFNAAIKVLKDDGVKTKVIKHYLPMINHYTNFYLRKLGYSVSFEFDDNFNEIIKARHRDKFSYGSFSEGEKTRINLALMFTWRSIAKLKNNAACNLLILDEILDGSLDQDGIADFIEIIGENTASNIIVISHRDEAASANFDKNVLISSENQFSKMTVSK